MSIHPTAIVDPSAKIPNPATSAHTASFDAGVELGENCELISNVVLGGPSRFGSDNKIYPFAVLGMRPAGHQLQGRADRGSKSATTTSFANM